MAGDDVISTAHISGNSDTHEKIDPLSPFFLGSHDIPGITISQVKLTSNNYEDWSRSMRMSLKSRRKFGFCDGTIKKPTDKLLLEQWEIFNCITVQWLRNTIDSSALESVPYVEDAAALWGDLEERFSVVDGTLIHSLKTELVNCKQTKGMSVTTYYGKLKSLWDALAVHEPPFACKCGRWLCNIAPQAIKRLDNERLPLFFRALIALYMAERLLGEASPSPDVLDIVAFAVPGVYHTSTDWKALREKEKMERRKLFCSHCTIHGHDLNSCFIKQNKFPDWWGSRPRTLADFHHGKTNGAGAGNSGASGSGSHRNTGGSLVHANVVTTAPCDASYSIASSDRLSGTCNNWIIDTGASNHVTGNPAIFTEHTTISPRPVGLPNRQQLTTDNNYVLKFAKDFCFIQDRSSKTMIGVGELRDVLYFLHLEDKLSTVHIVGTMGMYKLWHYRLGNPGDQVVKFIPLAHTFNLNKRLVCDVCHLAKQHRHSFDLRDNIANAVFDLIHCDLWGPYCTPSSCGAK
ncbi:uncharacterized protein LOC141631539 [Silene latifolia]|uniref:uncharacterized protein LOC141631539 n=1 Tax=Silene latifolia TaxID=37657 RepID=UPI003D76A6E0